MKKVAIAITLVLGMLFLNNLVSADDPAIPQPDVPANNGNNGNSGNGNNGNNGNGNPQGPGHNE